jgi:hypothetical protein
MTVPDTHWVDEKVSRCAASTITGDGGGGCAPSSAHDTTGNRHNMSAIFV